MKLKIVQWNCNNYVTVLKGSSFTSIKCKEEFRTLENMEVDNIFATCPDCGEDLLFKECGKIVGDYN